MPVLLLIFTEFQLNPAKIIFKLLLFSYFFFSAIKSVWNNVICPQLNQLD